MIRRAVVLALIVLGSTLIALLFQTWGGLTGVTRLERETLDWRQVTTSRSLLSATGDSASEVVLVLFDSASVDAWPYMMPFPRTVLAGLVDAVHAAGARTIGLDVYLDRLYDDTPAQAVSDTLLRDAIARAGNVVLVGPVVESDSGTVLGRPHPFFDSVAVDVGTAETPTSYETVQEGTLAARTPSGLEPSFPMAAWAHYRGVDLDSLLAESERDGRIELPGLPSEVGHLDDDEAIVTFPLHWIGPPSSTDAADPPGAFPAVSSSTVETLALLDPRIFEDRIVLLGTGFHNEDKFRTSFFDHVTPPDSTTGFYEVERPYGWMFGVEVHAHTLKNMLDETYVRRPGGLGNLLILLASAALTATVAFRWGAGVGGLATVGTVLGLATLAFWAWAGEVYVPGARLFGIGRPYLWLPIVTPALAAVLGYVGSVAWVSIVEGRDKRFIRRALGMYVSPDVASDIASDPDSLRLGGQKRPLTLLFSDLAGFTDMSEQMDPEDLVAKMNDYLTVMTAIVHETGGTLDKYIGDAIMAFWNAPKDVEDHADRGLATAILMQRKMGELNERWGAGDPDAKPMVVRIGVNTGDVVVGNVGSETKFNYSAIGDAVNLAARLEPANKVYGTLTMVSEFTLAAADRDAYRLRFLDYLAVKGKEQPVEVYELLEFADAPLPPEREEALSRFEEGLAAYRARAWSEAAGHFEAALAADPNDPPSKVYLERSRTYEVEPPPADWDFVVRLTSK